MASFYKTANSFKQGSMTLPQKYYVDDLILKQELEHIFLKVGFVLEEVMKSINQVNLKFLL